MGQLASLGALRSSSRQLRLGVTVTAEAGCTVKTREAQEGEKVWVRAYSRLKVLKV